VAAINRTRMKEAKDHHLLTSKPHAVNSCLILESHQGYIDKNIYQQIMVGLRW